MSGHLSSREISEWAAGTRSVELENHLHDCAECRGQLALLHGALSDFRDSLRSWRGSAPQPVWLADHPRGAHRLRWALVAVATVLLAAVPIYRSRERRRAIETSLEDTVLLEQIDAGVSRSVPAPMEPLTSLVSWSSTSAAATQQKK
jgi:predicted anti-sigma-YlaC factor YlaD